MIKLTEIRDSAVLALSTMFPDIEIYDEKQEQGMIFPCFFVQLIPITTARYKKNINQNRVMVSVQYFAESATECLDAKDKLDVVFSKYLSVSGRTLKVRNVEFETKQEIVGNSISYIVNLDYFSSTEEEVAYDIAGNLQINFNKE